MIGFKLSLFSSSMLGNRGPFAEEIGLGARLIMDFAGTRTSGSQYYWYEGQQYAPDVAGFPGWTFSRPGYNMLLRSQELDNAAWTKYNATVTADSVAAPDGTLTADTLTGTTDFASVAPATAITVLPSTAYTLSVYMRAGNWSVGSLVIEGANNVSTAFTLSGAGSTLNNATGFTNVSSTITALVGGWYRCSLTFTTPATGVNSNSIFPRLWIGQYSSGSTGRSVSFWGAQLEPGVTMGGYQLTTGTAITSGVNTAYALNNAGSLVAFGPNQPRITDRGLLIEEARTNLAKNNRFQDWTGTAPNGYTSSIASRVSKVQGVIGTNALRINGPFFNDGNRVSAPSFDGMTPSTTYTATMRIRKVRGSTARLGIAVDSWGSSVFLFDLSSTPLGQWVTISVTATSSASVMNSGGFHTDGTDSDLEIDWWQLEAGGFATSPIINDSLMIRTRAADNASVTGLAAMLGQFRTNKVAVYNANPVDTTGWSKTGDAASTLTVVDDAAALSAAGLSGLASSGKVLKLDNSAGTGVAYALANGATGNTNTHSVAVWVRGGTGAVGLNGGGVTSAFTSAGAYTRRTAQRTPANSSVVLGIGADAGQVVYFILPLLEESATAGADIVTLGAPASAGNPVTLVAWGDYPYAGNSVDQAVASLSDGTGANTMSLRRGSSGVFGANSRFAGNWNPDPNPATGKSGVRTIKAAARLRANQLNNAVDGVYIGGGGALSGSPRLTTLTLGDYGGSGGYLNGYVQRVQILGDTTDTVLQQLTVN